MIVQGGLFHLKGQPSVASETFSDHSWKKAEIAKCRGKPLTSRPELYWKVSQMLFKIELKHSETLWPVQFKEKKYPEVLQVSGLGNARTLTQTFPRLKDFYICYWPITWHLVSFLNNLDVVINNSSRFMQQQSIYLGKQSLKNRSPPTQYDWVHKHNSHCKQLLSSSYQLSTFSPDTYEGPTQEDACLPVEIGLMRKKKNLSSSYSTASTCHGSVRLEKSKRAAIWGQSKPHPGWCPGLGSE